MGIKPASPAHKAFWDDMIALLAKHTGQLQADEMLAVASQMVGQIVAMQDQRKMRPGDAMTIVASNIEMGNARAVRELGGQPSGSA